jgi:hypothetical protein
VTVPITGVPAGHATVKLVTLTVDASMSRLNLAISIELVATPVTMGVRFAGVVEMTRGALVTVGVPRIGSFPPPSPQATSKLDNAATKIVSLIKVLRLEHSRECFPCGGFEKS